MDTMGLGIRDLETMERFLHGEKIESTSNVPFYYVNRPMEAIIVVPSNLRAYRKAPYLTESMNVNDIKLLEAMNNRYIPIYNSETNQLLFTEEEFRLFRVRMGGLKEYGAGDYTFSPNLYFPGLDKYLSKIDENIRQVDFYRDKVYQEIIRQLSKYGFTVTIGCNSGGDIELVEAGSTDRYTNVPSLDGSQKWDFDFTIRFNPELTWKVKQILENDLQAEGHITKTSTYKVRLVDVTIPGLEKPLDIDFSLTPQKDNYLSTEDAIKERLENMRAQDPQKYRLVLANIMYAKDMLKKAGSYKPARGILEGDRQNGGLGGVGIENWILQNGGSLIDACEEFLRHAEGKEFKDFEQEYAIMDFGANHVAKSKRIWPYDNFIINNMRYLGYERMRETLRTFMETYELKTDTEKVAN